MKASTGHIDTRRPERRRMTKWQRFCCDLTQMAQGMDNERAAVVLDVRKIAAQYFDPNMKETDK